MNNDDELFVQTGVIYGPNVTTNRSKAEGWLEKDHGNVHRIDEMTEVELSDRFVPVDDD